MLRQENIAAGLQQIEEKIDDLCGQLHVAEQKKTQLEVELELVTSELRKFSVPSILIDSNNKVGT
jgi:uncharacterized protein (DUF3084 family)